MAVRIITYDMHTSSLPNLCRKYTWRTEDVALIFKYKAHMPVQARPSLATNMNAGGGAGPSSERSWRVAWCGAGAVVLQYSEATRRRLGSPFCRESAVVALLVDLGQELVVAEERVLVLADLEGRAAELCARVLACALAGWASLVRGVRCAFGRAGASVPKDG
jgi:hypothetical protein